MTQPYCCGCPLNVAPHKPRIAAVVRLTLHLINRVLLRCPLNVAPHKLRIAAVVRLTLHVINCVLPRLSA